MTDDTIASAGEQTHAPLPPSHPSSSPQPSNPRKTPPASLAIHTCLKDHYKNLPLETVAEDLAYALEMPGSRRKVLNQQVHSLDAFFNQLLIQVPKNLHHMPLLNLALKAQRQCQLTSASLSVQKKSDKRTDSSRNASDSFMNAKI